jgi:hypothetical protein
MTPTPMGVKSAMGECLRRTAGKTFFMQNIKSSRFDDKKHETPKNQ